MKFHLKLLAFCLLFSVFSLPDASAQTSTDDEVTVMQSDYDAAATAPAADLQGFEIAPTDTNTKEVNSMSQAISVSESNNAVTSHAERRTHRQYAYFQAPGDNDDGGVVVAPPEESFFGNIWDYLKENWIASLLGLLAFLKVVVNLTPTEADNKVFAWLDRIINMFIPNRRAAEKGGGTHPNA